MKSLQIKICLNSKTETRAQFPLYQKHEQLGTIKETTADEADYSSSAIK